MTSITLITAKSDLSSVKGRIGFLCETAPDGTIPTRYPEALTITELIGDFSETKQRAAHLAAKLLAGEPMPWRAAASRFRGTRHSRVPIHLSCHKSL